MIETALQTKESLQKSDLCRNGDNAVWIIRFSDGSLRSIHGTYEEARGKAEELKGSREVIAII